MFEGKKIKLGDQDWIIPPLSLRQVKNLQKDIESLEADESGLDTVVKLVQAAMSRNYPTITVEQLEEWIDLGNVKHLVEIILGQSGFKLGEVGAEAKLTGTPSLPSSLQ